MTRQQFQLLFLFLIFFACESIQEEIPVEEKILEFQMKEIYSFPEEGVFASNLSDGARLNGFIQIKEGHYQAIISPENIPINSSAWYALQIWGGSPKTIELSLKYTHHKHRYIPKVSRDGKNWRSIPAEAVSLNQDSTIASFSVQLSSDTLWIAAQEMFSTATIYSWMDRHMDTHNTLKKELTGQSVLNKNIYVYSSEVDSIRPSVLIVARQHPPEVPGGTIAFQAFFEEIYSSSAIAKLFRERFNIYTFPVLNPDGVDLGHWRHNANGVDLNRDWKDFQQAETQVVRDFMRKKVKEQKKFIAFGFDFHTSYTGPYLLILELENEQNLETQIIPEWTRKVGNETPLLMEYKRRDQSLPYFYNWLYNEFKAEAVTYEEGDEIDRSIIKSRAKLYAQKWMATMLMEYYE